MTSDKADELLERIRSIVADLTSGDEKKMEIALDPNTAVIMAELFDELDQRVSFGRLPMSWDPNAGQP